MAKLNRKVGQEKNLFDILGVMATQPVFVGMTAYAIVNQFPTLFSALANTSANSPPSRSPAGQVGTGQHILNVTGNPIIDFFSGLVSGALTGGQGATTGNPTGTGIGGTGIGYNILGDLEIAAIKGALILYIASGGNLAGVLTAAGGSLETLFKGMLPAVAAAAATA